MATDFPPGKDHSVSQVGRRRSVEPNLRSHQRTSTHCRHHRRRCGQGCSRIGDLVKLVKAECRTPCSDAFLSFCSATKRPSFRWTQHCYKLTTIWENET